MKILFLWIGLLISTNVIAGAKSDKEQKGDHHIHPGDLMGKTDIPNPNERFAKRLGLDEVQTKKFLAMKEEDKKKIAALDEKYSKIQADIGGMMTSTKSKDELLASFHEGQKILAEISEVNFKTGLELREMLRPEQKANFAKQLMGPGAMKPKKPIMPENNQHGHSHKH